jgi:MazG family protein
VTQDPKDPDGGRPAPGATRSDPDVPGSRPAEPPGPRDVAGFGPAAQQGAPGRPDVASFGPAAQQGAPGRPDVAGFGPAAQRGAPGTRLLDLVAVMDRLRTECPWDAKQTHESLAPYLLEETYEALEALEGGDAAALREELGDVLLQVLFHARIAAERADGTGYTIDDVAGGIAGKLVRRHPHVFGDVTVAGAGEVKKNWDEIKAAERAAARAVSGGGAGSVLDGVPFGQPALSLAAQLQRRAGRAGAPPELADLAEPADFHDPAKSGGESGPDLTSHPVSQVGAALFGLVASAIEAGLDPELELRAAARAYRDRVRAWEQDHRA